MRLRLRAYRSVDEPQTSQRYFEGHLDVLRIYGITEITSAKDRWYENPASFAIIAETVDEGKIVGGIRVHSVGGTQPLPVEDAIGEMDAKIYDMVRDHHIKNGAGELCGLWNSRDVAGMGVSMILIRAGLAITEQLELDSIFGICADLTLPMFKKVGYEIEETLGNKGTFYYPKSDLLANALVMDARTLRAADPIEREKILHLRDEPQQTRTEVGPKGALEIEYDLVLQRTAVGLPVEEAMHCELVMA